MSEKKKEPTPDDLYYQTYADQIYVYDKQGNVIAKRNIDKLAFHKMALDFIRGAGGIHYDRFTQNVYFRDYDAITDTFTKNTLITKNQIKAIYINGGLSVLKGADMSQLENLVIAKNVEYSDPDYKGYNVFDSLTDFFNAHVSKDNVEACVNMVANWQQFEEPGEHYYHSLSDIVKFKGLTEEQNEIVIKYILISCKALALNIHAKGKPIQPEIFPILNGEQGIGKTRFCKLFAFDDIDYCLDSFDFSKSEEDLYRLKNNKWIVEVGEMKGCTKGNVEKIKAFLTGKTQEVRKLYTDNDKIIYQPRQYYFLTTNKFAFLNDVQNRRFISLGMPEIMHKFDDILEWMPYFYSRCDAGSFDYDTDYFKLQDQVREIATSLNDQHVDDTDIQEVLEVAEDYIYKYGFVKAKYIKQKIHKLDPFIAKDLNNVLQQRGYTYTTIDMNTEEYIQLYNNHYKGRTYVDICGNEQQFEPVKTMADILARDNLKRGFYKNVDIQGDIFEYQRARDFDTHKQGCRYAIKCFIKK